MAEITIRLIYNLKTGRKDIYVDYESEADALPIEHEQAHRQIVENLIGQGLVQAEEVGEVVIQRGEQTGAATKQTEPMQQAEMEEQSEG